MLTKYSEDYVAINKLTQTKSNSVLKKRFLKASWLCAVSMYFTIVIYSSTKCPTFTAENISPIILSFFLPLCIKITFRQIESNLLMRVTDLQQCQPSCHGVFTLLFHSHTMTAALVTLGSGVCTRLSATCGQIIVFISLMRNWYTYGYLSGWTYWWWVSDNRPGSGDAQRDVGGGPEANEGAM